jgi:hypothetical protein
LSRREPWEAADVQCPFYIESEKTKIKCEGFLEESTVTLAFRQKTSKEKYMGTFCAGPFQNCSVYQQTMTKYKS